jgi:hypothetical protein
VSLTALARIRITAVSCRECQGPDRIGGAAIGAGLIIDPVRIASTLPVANYTASARTINNTTEPSDQPS